MSLDLLWASYFELGGKADPLEFEAIFMGLLQPDRHQFNVIAHALNELLIDQDEEYRVPYEDSEGAG